jgi:2-keto-4-pentenoate hydratase/2-oxohepta-3-ene-1,7-dioic acid hydratase in catechol pathway
MGADYRLLTYLGAGRKPVAGVLIGDRVHDLAPLLSGARGIDTCSILGLLQHWRRARPALAKAAAKARGGKALSRLTLLPPILHPPAVFCAGANYWDHLEEMGELVKRMTGSAPKMEKLKEPWFFIKTAAHSLLGHGAALRLPPFSKMVDWEIELGAVIGTPARNIPVERALDCVAGYVIVNDVSARDFLKREGSPFIYDWLGQKCFDDACPMGPWITPAHLVPDPMKLALRLAVNGVVKQESSTAKMVHSLEEQIAYLSSRLTLRPGDVIATGTPAGVGLPRGEFLKPGDEMRLEIEGCGILVNRCVAGAA